MTNAQFLDLFDQSGKAEKRKPQFVAFLEHVESV